MSGPDQPSAARAIGIVTGASAGLGEAFARQVDVHPAFAGLREIWLVARRGERLQALADELPSGRGVAVAADLAVQPGVDLVLARARASGARVQLLVNNAGFGLLGPLASQDPEQLGRMLDLNVRAGTLLLRGLAPQMHAGARVLQVASAAAYVPAPYFAAYAASKSYALALALALREEWRARGISVCAVCPGPVRTEFFAAAGADARAYADGLAPGRVVALALRDVLADRAVSHAGIGPGLLAWVAGVVPRSVLVRLSGRRNLRRASSTGTGTGTGGVSGGPDGG
jgi:short-subunit dehydrogenase